MMSNKTMMYTDNNLKKQLKDQSNYLGLSMSEYLRCLLKINLLESNSNILALKYKTKQEEINYIKERLQRGKL